MPPEPPPPPPADSLPIPEAPPPAPEEAPVFKVNTGVGFRLGWQLQDPTDPEELGVQQIDELNVEPRFSGQVTKYVGWTANFTVSGRTRDTILNGDGDGDGQVNAAAGGGAPIRFEARALDLVGQLDFMDEFHIWGGRMLTPSDRSNFSGAWFMSPWDYPGVYGVGSNFAYVGPRGTEELGREVGTTIWGQFGGGTFKYYAALMDLDDPEVSPLYSGRLQLALVGKEPGFYGSSTYYGSQNIVALGVAAQYQKRSTVAAPDDDLTEFNADLLAEYNVEGTGTFSGELAYYNMNGPVFAAEQAYFVVLSYLTPSEIGIGKLQPMVRYQATIDPDMSIVEVFANYVMKDYFAKLQLGYQRTDMGTDAEGEDIIGNAVQLGFQIQQ
jgi:hypothetical protein